MLRQFFAPGVLLVTLAISVWLLRNLDLSAPGGAGGIARTPDFYMDNFVTTTMDESGRARRRVEAAHMAHFPDTDTSEFTSPYLVLYRDEGQPLHVTSERGWLSADGDVMLLLGDVHIWRNGPAGDRRMDIRTQDLRVLPETEYGETEKPVTITTPHSQSRGVGMRAFLDQGRVELLSQVHTVYSRGTFSE